MLYLTPGQDRFKPLGLFKSSRHGTVSLVLELATQQEKVARLFELPPGQSEVVLLEGINQAAATLRTVQQARVPRFDRIVEGQGGTWMLFEHVQGFLVSNYRTIEKTVSDNWIMWWLSQLLVTLEALHTHSPPIILGYLDPSDLVVEGDGLVLTDLGIFEDIFPDVGTSHLKKHSFQQFIAPERRTASYTSPRADIYSAAAVAFWLATGYSPVVVGPGARDQMAAGLERMRPSLPLHVRCLIADMLDFFPSRRPASAQEALDHLLPFTTSQRHKTPPPPLATEDVKFAAEATRMMVPGPDRPPNICDASQPQEETPAVTPPEPIFRHLNKVAEVADDLKWQLRAHPLLALGAVAVLSVVGLTVHSLVPAPRKAVPSPVMRVISGKVTVWGKTQTVQDLWPGTAISTDAEAKVSFDHSSLSLNGGSVLAIQSREHDSAAVMLKSGVLQVETVNQDSMVVHVNGKTVMVNPGSAVTITMVRPTATVSCQAGQATVNDGGTSTPLRSGQTQPL